MEYIKQSETEIKVIKQVENVISKDDIIRRIEGHQKEQAMLQALIDADTALLGEATKLDVKTKEEVKLAEKLLEEVIEK
jgi:hypothetical protein